MRACAAPACTPRFTVAKIWPRYWARVTNTIPNLRQPHKFLLDIKTAASLGPIMKNCIANCWLRADQSMGSPRATLTAYACYVLKNPQCNATAGSPRNILHRIFPTSTLCICKKTPRWGAFIFWRCKKPFTFGLWKTCVQHTNERVKNGKKQGISAKNGIFRQFLHNLD